MTLAIRRFGLFFALILLAGLLPLGSPAHARARAQANLPRPLRQDESCLACHGQTGMKSDSGKSISIDPAKHVASVHGILSCSDCHTSIKDYPHAAKVSKVKCATCHGDEASHVPTSVHSALGDGACRSCHGDHHEVAAAAQTAPAKCASCHADEVKEFRQSIHGRAAAAGDPDAPTCMSCHGPVHQIQTSGDAASTVAKKNLPDTCASCHSNQQFLSRHKIPFARPVELYKQSVHGRAVVDGDGAAASCSAQPGAEIERNAQMKRPRCERKGTLPHPATNALTWELQSGRLTKFFCDDHSEDVSPQPYFVSELVGYHERAKAATKEEMHPMQRTPEPSE